MTELDLRHSLVPEEVIDELKQSLPRHQGPAVQEQDQDVPQYDYVSFMEKFTANARRSGGDGGGGSGGGQDDNGEEEEEVIPMGVNGTGH